MSKPPPKPKAGTPTQSRTAGGKTHLTRATTAALVTNKNGEHISPPKGGVESNVPKSMDNLDVAGTAQASTAPTPQISPLRMIADTLAHIIKGDKMDVTVKQDLEDVIKFAREAETKEQPRTLEGESTKTVSAIRDAVKADLVEMYKSLANQINSVQATSNTNLEYTTKLLKEVEEAKTEAKELATKVTNVTDTTNRLASETTSYRDALLARPTQPTKANADLKVLNNMDR